MLGFFKYKITINEDFSNGNLENKVKLNHTITFRIFY